MSPFRTTFASFCYLLLLFVYSNVSLNVGPITIKEFGKSVERYVVSTNTDGITVSGSTITLSHGSQVQIANNGSFESGYSPDMYREYILQNRTVSYTVNISTIGCSCNAAFYFASMPGYSANGSVNPNTLGNYYCDANDLSDFCWEMDVMEANKYVLQVTPHSCSQSPGSYISQCDTSGCCTNSYVVNTMGICPNSSCAINTMFPFRLSISFLENTTIHVTITQSQKTFSFSACWFITDYLKQMTEAWNYGMVMVMSYWGSTYQEMSWLDRMTGCAGDCDTNGQAIFSDIEIE